MLYRSGLVWGVLSLVLSMACVAAATQPPDYYAVDLGPLPGSADSNGSRKDVSGWTVNNLGPGGRLRHAILCHFAELIPPPQFRLRVEQRHLVRRSMTLAIPHWPFMLTG